MNKQDIPNPGSDEALEMGCTCAVLDNAHGKGYMGIADCFVITEHCPVHDPIISVGDPEGRKGEE